MESNEQRKSRDPLYITIIILLLGVGGFYASTYYSLKSDYDVVLLQRDSLKAENDTVLGMLEKNGMVDLMGENLKDNLQFMLDSYAEIKTSNDTMNNRIAQQREKIKTLMAEAEKHKGDAYMIRRLQKEGETLRKIMKSYVHTIDSLNTLNEGLRADIKVKDQKISDVSKERDDLSEKNQNLSDKVAKGSILQAGGVTATAIRLRSGGKQVETTKAGRTDMIKSCFTIMENRIAKAGTKEIYMVVITPGGTIISNNPSNTVTTEDGVQSYSAKREVEYANANLDLCMYSEIVEGLELKAGTYIVKIYCDKAMIGKSTFTLK